ncbi:hypothetical protein [Chitinophaga nivalis]|uniref:Uncharacterized protein n=1 Tax=Chitinophaga nivalis TaxID=2991709 RepID=A0ABT3IPQ6_9BACT|nr:hypothetical protein [Chitinophaga nivalis]MCW3464438.1 hypothetical protein [Chitinophaga nivalis]MCW3485871.1 hypothetical protein [Chitinophaga nivalis]
MNYELCGKNYALRADAYRYRPAARASSFFTYLSFLFTASPVYPATTLPD